MSKTYGAYIDHNEIVTFLKHNIQLREVYQRILQQKIINQATLEKNITVTPEEIQNEADLFRHANRLQKASDTLAWLADQMITVEDWEAGISYKLLAAKLSEHLFSKEVEKFFAQNKLDFEQILLYQIVVPYHQLAQELFYQIEEEEISFYEAAHLYDIDERRRYQCGYEGKLYRSSLKPDIAAVVFSANIGENIFPIKSDRGYHLLRVEEFFPAELTPQLRQDIINRMFNEWLISELNYMLHNTIP